MSHARKLRMRPELSEDAPALWCIASIRPQFGRSNKTQRTAAMDDSMKFNLYLQQISQQLSRDDLEYLKFLYEWEIPESSRRMERVRSGMDLFVLLKDEGKLSADNLFFLNRILTNIRRQHLLDDYVKLDSGAASAVSRAAALTNAEPLPLSAPQRFAECLVKIAQCLTSNNMDDLQFLFRKQLHFSDDWKPSPTQLFLELEGN